MQRNEPALNLTIWYWSEAYKMTTTKLFHDILHKLYNNHDFIFEIGSKAKDRAISTYHCDNVASKTISFYRKCLSINFHTFIAIKINKIRNCKR